MEMTMQTRNKMMDDLSQLMTNAMGVAQGAREEAETAMKSVVDRWLADRDFVTREEFDAVRAMAQKGARGKCGPRGAHRGAGIGGQSRRLTVPVPRGGARRAVAAPPFGPRRLHFVHTCPAIAPETGRSTTYCGLPPRLCLPDR
jgi:hypothetical protein